MNKELFENLFVLELADNHLGKVERGLKIINQFSKVVKQNNIRAAFKFHFRDTDSFIHQNFLKSNMRYIKKTLAVKTSEKDYAIMIDSIRKNKHIVMSTPFDEAGVDMCIRLDVQIIKIASADINNAPLIERIIETRKPCIVSTGGYYLKDLDDLVQFFEVKKIPLAINHCVSLYPTEDKDLQLNQIDFLMHRYPNHIIGFSSHEYHDWQASMFIAYGKGVRTFERHIDIEDGILVSPYCSTPDKIDIWFKAYNKAKEICGGSPRNKRFISREENEYLNALVRGVYAKRDLPKNYIINPDTVWDDIYLAIPLQKGQISCREIIHNERLLKSLKEDDPMMLDDIDSSYSYNEEIKQLIYNRGI